MTDRKSPGQANRAALRHYFLLLETVADDWQQLMGTCMSRGSTRKKKPPRVAAYFGILQKYVSSQEAVLLPGKHFTETSDGFHWPSCRSKSILLQKPDEKQFPLSYFFVTAAASTPFCMRSTVFRWLILRSPDKKWALTTVTLLCGFLQALSTIQGHLKWWLLYDTNVN